MSAPPILRSFARIRQCQTSLRSSRPHLRQTDFATLSISRRFASLQTSKAPKVPDTDQKIGSGEVTSFNEETIESIKKESHKSLLEAVQEKAAPGGGREFSAWLTLFTIQKWINHISNEADIPFHRVVRSFLNLMLAEAQLVEPRLECAIHLFILRSALSANDEDDVVGERHDSHLSKLVSASVIRLERLQQKVGPERLGELFLPTLAVCARYAYVSATSPKDYKIALERFKYVYDKQDSWKDEKHPFVEIVSRADFLVWYAEVLEMMGKKEDKPQTLEMLETAAYTYNHFDAYKWLINFYKKNSLDYHRCLCVMASQPYRQGAASAILLAQLYSLPNAEFQKLDKELQAEINLPLQITAKETMPKLQASDSQELKSKFQRCLDDIMREYSDLGILPADPQYWTKLNVPARYFKALYWFNISQFQNETAYLLGLQLSKEHNLLAEGLLTENFQLFLWQSRAKPSKFIESLVKESTKAATRRLAFNLFQLMASFLVQRQIPVKKGPS